MILESAEDETRLNTFSLPNRELMLQFRFSDDSALIQECPHYTYTLYIVANLRCAGAPARFSGQIFVNKNAIKTEM